MKHLTVELAAIDEIVGERFLQSIEFDSGRTLAALVKGQISTATLNPKLRVVQAGEGLFITGLSTASGSRYLVIDLQQSKMFDELSDADALFVFQKLLRFAKKAWQGLSLNFSERFISGTSKAIVFPFRGFKPAPFRITIERDPMSERLAKRGDKGNFLLAYKAGHEGGDAAREVAEFTNFRKAYDAIGDVRVAVKAQPSQPSDAPIATQLHVAELFDSGANQGTSMYRRFEDWLPLLTTQQANFVQGKVDGPYRIEGAAGTGKTLSLMLKAIFSLREAKRSGSQLHLVFVTHSDATKRSIAEVISVIDGDRFYDAQKGVSAQTIKICTLSELCAEQLRQAISDTEFIDRDAMESKGLQLLYISESLSEAMSIDYASHERFLSPDFNSFLKSEDSWKIVEMVQHEISVVIKGRAAEDLDKYKKVSPLRYGLPATTDADKGFVFAIFRLYQQKLGEVGQFDTDDVVLTTIGQLDTPIWRRRRLREGFDAVFIDETHLFNINELHLFHYFTKSEGPYPIIYSVDRSQAVGDRGWTTADIAQSLGDGTVVENESHVKTIFRSSIDIVNLAFSIVSSGATLFTNFDNPVNVGSSAFTDSEEKLSRAPVYFEVPNEEALIEAAFNRADALYRDMGCRRSDILIVTLDEGILEKLQLFATEKNKAHLLLKKRGDALAVESARQSSQIILAHADYVGGLEFNAVILVGIDGGRVPPTSGESNVSSKNYLSYAAHNRLYVAVTRAKYRVEILGEKARGPSKIIEPAIAAGLVEKGGDI